MFKKINQCDIYVFMWCIYMLQEVLYSPGIINQLLQLIMILWCTVAMFKYMIQPTESSSILRVTILLIAMYTIYGIIHILFGKAIMMHSQYIYLRFSLNSLAPIFLFYFFTKNGELTSDRIRIYLPILIVICILLFYKEESRALLKSNKEEVTNNGGYYFIALIPFLFFYVKKPILQYLFLGIILLYVILAMKRGAILIGTVASMVFLYANMKNSSRRTKILVILSTIAIVVGISQYIDFMMSSSEYFTSRVDQTLEGNSSNRDIIYGTLWNSLILEPNPFYFYFGRGADSSLEVVGSFAHQDWLETFCNNGLVGVIILFYFFYILGKNVWKSKQYFPRIIFYSFATLFIITFSKTLFSMSIQNLDMPITMLLGYFSYWIVESTNNLENDYYDQDE